MPPPANCGSVVRSVRRAAPVRPPAASCLLASRPFALSVRNAPLALQRGSVVLRRRPDELATARRRRCAREQASTSGRHASARRRAIGANVARILAGCTQRQGRPARMRGRRSALGDRRLGPSHRRRRLSAAQRSHLEKCIMVERQGVELGRDTHWKGALEPSLCTVRVGYRTAPCVRRCRALMHQRRGPRDDI